MSERLEPRSKEQIAAEVKHKIRHQGLPETHGEIMNHYIRYENFALGNSGAIWAIEARQKLLEVLAFGLEGNHQDKVRALDGLMSAISFAEHAKDAEEV